MTKRNKTQKDKTAPDTLVAQVEQIARTTEYTAFRDALKHQQELGHPKSDFSYGIVDPRELQAFREGHERTLKAQRALQERMKRAIPSADLERAGELLDQLFLDKDLGTQYKGGSKSR